VLYAGLVVWLTWPLGVHVATHRANTHPACGFDPLHMAWALAHETHALTTAPTRFNEANIYFPARRALFYGDGGFGALPYFMPTFLLSGNPTLALNLTFLGCIALTACALHLVVRIWTGSHLGGFVAAWTFLMTRWTLWEFVPSAPQYAVLQYIPFIILVAAKPATSFKQTLLLPVAAEYGAVRAGNPNLSGQTWWRWWHPITALPWGLLWGYGASTAVPLATLGLIVVGTVSLVVRADSRRSPPTAWAHSAFWAVTGVIMSLSPTATWYGRPLRLPNSVIADW